MRADTFANSLILTGPTGSGKSRLALELAPQLNAEIIAMDSMTLYRGMDIGTAKPTAEDRARVLHHLLDVLDPWESASVAWWLEQAAARVRDIEARGRVALFAGGTSFYLKALLFGLFDGPARDEALRTRLTEEAERAGKEVLHARLAAVDPATAVRLHPNDVRRVIRALEVHELTGKPISALQTQWRPAAETRRQGDKETRRQGDRERAAENPPPVSLSPYLPVSLSPCLEEVPRVLCLDLPREKLYLRIDERVREMFAAGLVEEVRALVRLDRPLSREAKQALGYKELFAYLDGQTTLEEAVQLVQMRSRNYAKRQLSAFRHIPGCRMVSRELTFDLWKSRMKKSGERSTS
jgi:tRNA dimethylallyltransferase